MDQQLRLWGCASVGQEGFDIGVRKPIDEGKQHWCIIALWSSAKHAYVSSRWIENAAHQWYALVFTDFISIDTGKRIGHGNTATSALSQYAFMIEGQNYSQSNNVQQTG